MNKKPNFILITISNLLFCFILILISAFLIFKFKFECQNFIAYICMLLVGISSGKATSKCQSKKLLNSFISSTIFLVIYFVISCILKGKISNLNCYLIVAFNIYLGTFIGCVLTASKMKGRFKK